MYLTLEKKDVFHISFGIATLINYFQVIEFISLSTYDIISISGK